MTRGPDSGAHTRSGYLGRLAGATLAMFALATVAYAAISPISPSSGTLEPGSTTTATFTLHPDLILLTCLSASVTPSFEGAVDLNGSPTFCAVLNDEEVLMTVTAGEGATPGDYMVEIDEILSNTVVDTHTWPFTVVAPPTTTTTSTTTTTTTTPATTSTTPTTTTSTNPTTTSTNPTTTSTNPTTTSTNPTTTSTPPGQTTTSTTPATTNPTTRSTQPGRTTTSTAPTTTESTVAATTGTSAVTTTGPTTGGTGSSPPSSAGPSDTFSDEDHEVVAASPTTGPPYDRSTSEPDDPEFLSTTVLSDQLRRQITGSIPLPIADAVLSPLVIVEFLVRSLFQSALALVIPLLIATLVGLWMVWRMRKEVDENELSLSTESLV